MDLEVIERLAAGGPVELGTIISEFGLRAHAIVSFVLCIPFMQPIPLAGVSTLIGIVIAILGAMLALNIRPKLPRFLAKRQIPGQLLTKIAEVGHRILIRFERVIRPRGMAVHEHPVARVVSALIICICGVLLALPLPIPFSNSIPAITIALVSLGIVERDGLLVIAGYLAFCVAIAFFVGLVLLPYFGIKNLPDFLKELTS